MNTKIEKTEKIMLSNVDIAKALTTMKIRPNYKQISQIKDLTTIDQLFEGVPYCIIFTATNEELTGHFQLIFKNSGKLFFFDSYGKSPSYLLKKVFRIIGPNAWNQDFNLCQLILNSEYFAKNDAYMNVYAFQSPAIDMATCGRHVISCIFFLLQCIENNMEFSFDIYYRWLESLTAHFGLQNFDQTVSKFITGFGP